MLQSDLKKVQQVATKRSGVSKADWDKVYKNTNKVQPGSRTTDVAATVHLRLRLAGEDSTSFKSLAIDAEDN